MVLCPKRTREAGRPYPFGDMVLCPKRTREAGREWTEYRVPALPGPYTSQIVIISSRSLIGSLPLLGPYSWLRKPW